MSSTQVWTACALTDTAHCCSTVSFMTI